MTLAAESAPASRPTASELMQEISEVFASGKVADPYPMFNQRRDESPLMQGDILAEFGTPSMAAGFDGKRPVVTLFRYDDCLAALKDTETFSSEIIGQAFRPLVGKVLTGLEGEEHTRLRNLMMPGLGRENFAAWTDEIIEPVVRRMAKDLAASGTMLDLTEFAVQFPVRIIYEVIGFPADDEEAFDRFQANALTILLGFGSTDPSQAAKAQERKGRAVQAVKDLYDDLLPIVQRRRAEGATGNNLISHLLRTEVDGDRLDDDEVVVFTRSLLPAAAETTTRSFGNLMVCLLTRPDVLEEVRNDRSLVLKAVTESTRFEPVSVMAARLTTRDVEVRGTVIPEGTGITMVKGAAMRDPEIWKDAETFDIKRSMAKPNLSFGYGPHTCMGMNLAKLEMASALNALLDELPGLRADPHAPPLEIRGVNLRQPVALPVTWG
ncbi:MAG: cytochrome [Frankiales bacterium]|nr:cytochrome [Frankiales bacterium]